MNECEVTAATANVAAAVAITFAGQMLPCNATGLTHILCLAPPHTSSSERLEINTQAHKCCHFTYLLCSIYSKHSHKNAQIGSSVQF